jgi:hypothetical protein
LLLFFVQVLRELDVELNDKVATWVVMLDGAQRIVVENWHALARDYPDGLGVDHLVYAEFYGFVVHGGEADGASFDSVVQTYLVLKNQVVHESSKSLVGQLHQVDDEV